MYKEKRQDHRFELGEERSLIDLALESTPENTKKAMWAFWLYETWAEWRRSAYKPESMRYKVGDILMLNLELHVMTEKDLNDVLSQFIGEVRKDQGERYPPKTVLSSVQNYIELKGKKVGFFSGREFEKLRKSSDVEMKSSARRNLGLNRKQAEVITVDIEKLLWKQGILGSDNPECLLRTVYYLIGLKYGMRAGDEHRRLGLNNFSFETDSMGKEYLLYSEEVSKTYHGGLKHG